MLNVNTCIKTNGSQSMKYKHVNYNKKDLQDKINES